MRINTSSLSADFFGGLSGAIAVLPQTLGLSVLLFTTIGLDASSGAMAGLIGATILLLSSGFMGATTGMISAPNGPVTMLLVTLVGTLAAEYSPAELLIIVGAVLLLTGIFQIIFGLLKGGEMIKLIPYPVVASMITAIGIKMILSQKKVLAPSDAIDNWHQYIPLIVAAVTLISIYLYKKYTPKLPSILMGLLTGIVVYPLLTISATDADPGWVIGTLPSLDFGVISGRFASFDMSRLPLDVIISSALALTVLVMIDCLLTALVADSQTSSRHDARKELVAQGTGQILVGLVGGVGGGGTKGSTLACTMAGGRRWSPVFAALLILSMPLFGRELGAFIPLSALSGVIIYIGINMINTNILLWFKGKYTRVDAFNAVMVIAATLAFGVTKAVALGMLFAVITFIRNGIKRPLIRRETNIIEYPSPRKRSQKHREILLEHADEALLIELQGNLYFARTDQLYQRIMQIIQGRKVIILHFRRALSIDMSGMVVLMQLVEAANKNGTEIVFVHLHKRLGFGTKMKRAFSMIESKKESITRIFNSTERALEYAEDAILMCNYKDKAFRSTSPVEFEENDLCKGLKEKKVVLLKNIAEKKEYKDKEIILQEGEENSSLYLITNGFVEQRLYNGPRSFKVLAKHSPGTYFGKLTFFNQSQVSTTFMADGDITLYKITRSDLEEQAREVGSKFLTEILFSIGGQLSKESRRLIIEIERLEAL